MKKLFLFLTHLLLFSSFIIAQSDIQWQKTFGGTEADGAEEILQTNDGSYIVSGYSYSNDSDVTGNHGYFDAWIIKLDLIGNIQWQKTFGGTQNDYAGRIDTTSDGGFIVIGNSDSNDGDVTGNHGYNDFWILKIDSLGILQWEKSFGGSYNDYASCGHQTNDGGYIITGTTLSINGDVSGNHGPSDYWIVKLDSMGTLLWQKTFGGTNTDAANSIEKTTDGGYIVAGNSTSIDGDVTVNHSNSVDIWIIKIDSTGMLQWEKSYGGTQHDLPHFIERTFDGGYIISGYSLSNDNDVTGNHGSTDAWIFKIDSIGILQWQKSFGGSEEDRAYFIKQTFDGGYIFSGLSHSIDGDLTNNYGDADLWVVKLSSTVLVSEINNSNLNFSVAPNPFSNETNISFQLLSTEKAEVVIYDIVGNEIINFTPKIFLNGINEISWNGESRLGNKVSNGIYFVSIKTDKICETKRIEVLRN